MRSLWHSRASFARVSILALIVNAAPAGARAAPEDSYLGHGYVEPCTVANSQDMFTECAVCSVTSTDPELCHKRLGRQGYEKKCRTRGEPRAWDEVWCLDQRTAKGTGLASALSLLAGMAALLGVFLFLKRSWSKQAA